MRQPVQHLLRADLGPCARAGLLGLLILVALPAAADLKLQVSTLAEAHGVEVRGLYHIEGLPHMRYDTDSSIQNQFEALLEHCNHVTFTAPDGSVEKIIISSHQHAPMPKVSNYVHLRHESDGHLIVDTTVTGPNGYGQRLPMWVDTGATMTVLPLSLAEKLGFREEHLDDSSAGTANGVVATKVGVLNSAQVAQAFQPDVEVAFIADEHLGAHALLGMSFLRHFKVFIDDAKDEMELRER